MAEAGNQAVSAGDLRRVLIDVTHEAGTALGQIIGIAKAALADLRARTADPDTKALVEVFKSIWAKAKGAQNVVDCEARTVDCCFGDDAAAANVRTAPNPWGAHIGPDLEPGPSAPMRRPLLRLIRGGLA